MIRRRRMLAAGAGALLPFAVRAQGFPSRPLRIVVPFGPGGIADLTVRAVAQKLSPALHQPIVIDNKPGAGGIVAGEAVAKAAPDGHTLLLASNGTAVSAGLFKSLPFDPLKDFAPVVLLGTFDLVVLVTPNSRFRTMKELLAFAKANPGKFNVATINVGSTQHLSAEMLKADAGVDFQVVPFNGSPAVLAALRGGQVDASIEIAGPMMSQVSAHALKPLAVLGAKRSPALTDVPTMAESGVSGFDVTSWNALVAPRGTPDAVTETLNREVDKVLQDPQLRREFAALMVTPAGGSPKQLGDLLASEVRRWTDLIVRAKVPRQ